MTSALDQVNVKRLMAKITEELQHFTTMALTPTDMALAAKKLHERYSAICHPVKIDPIQVLSKWKMTRNGHLQFLTVEGETVNWNQPRMRSRRLRRVWARKQLGMCLVTATFQPVIPLETIYINKLITEGT